MKKIIIVSLVAFVACSKPKVKKHTGVPERVIALFHNVYNGGFGLDSVFRVIRDTTKIDSNDNKIRVSDTVFYIKMSAPIPDTADHSGKTHLKGKDGKDSLSTLYYPLSPKEIIHPSSLE